MFQALIDFKGDDLLEPLFFLILLDESGTELNWFDGCRTFFVGVCLFGVELLDFCFSNL